MKTMIKYKAAMLSLTIGLFSSCGSDFLDPKPLSFYAPENALVDETGLQAVLDKAMTTFRGEFCSDQAPFLTNMKYSDVAVDGTTDKATPWQDLNNQMLPDGENNTLACTRIGWYWDNSYLNIKNCNTVINRINEATFKSEEAKNALLGGAYFVRAYRYYMKTLQYGDVPLVLEEPTDPKVDYYTTTKESIWKKMVKDLEFAVQYVPEANKVNKGKVTKAACKHLLAKYYLLEGRFDDAIRITSEVIDGGVHKLCTERFGSGKNLADKDVVWDMFCIENKSLSENTEGLLLTIDRYGMEGNTNGTFVMYNALPYYGLTGSIKTPNGANGMSDAANNEIGIVEKYGRGISRIRPTWYSQKAVWTINGVEDFSDYRHRTDNENWMTMEMLVYNNPALKKSKNEWYGKHLQLYSDDGSLLCKDTIRCWYGWPNYKTWYPDLERVQPRGGQGDFYIFRLAETYLLRAEAYIWKKEWQKAADDINTIRRRANAQYMYTAEDVERQQIGAVLDERARELYYEEPRKDSIRKLFHLFSFPHLLAHSFVCNQFKYWRCNQSEQGIPWYGKEHYSFGI